MDLRWHCQQLAATAGRKLLKWSGAYDGYWNHWRGDLFDRAEADGLHVLPVHYYSPVPNVAGLDPAIWQPRDAATGIDLRLDEALQTLAEMADRFRNELDEFPTEPADPRTFHLHNNAYGPGDAETLYCFLRHHKPNRVIEIGCGYSTLVASIAQTRNRDDAPGESFSYTCIEPFLPPYLRPTPPGVTEVIEKSVQSTPIARFEELQAGDVLFIDSTHVVALGSDVVYEYLEILPRLRPGVLVHIHDIFLPNDYPRQWADKSRFFWNEQYLLHAFLLFNDTFRVILPLHALFTQRKAELQEILPSLKRSGGPAGFWIEKL